MTKEELEKEAREYLAEHSKYSEVFGEFFVAVDTLTAMLDFAEPREKRIAELEQKLEQIKNEKFEKALSQIKHDREVVIEYNERLQKENAELKETVIKMNNVITETFSNLTKAKEIINDLVHLGEFNEDTDEEYFNYQVHEALKNAEQFLKEE